MSKTTEIALLIFDCLLPLVVCFYLVGTWVRWFRSDIRFPVPSWRSAVAAIGFGASTISVVVILAVWTYGLMGSGLQPQGSTFAHAILLTLITALTGLVCAFIGKDPLEIPAAICSGSCLLLLLLHAWAS